jgi:hypothetical protein
VIAALTALYVAVGAGWVLAGAVSNDREVGALATRLRYYRGAPYTVLVIAAAALLCVATWPADAAAAVWDRVPAPWREGHG